MRVFKSSLVYGDYIDAFYRQRPGLPAESFCQQIGGLLMDGFSFGDAWTHYLGNTGRYEVMEAVVNAAPAQRMWAREHSVRHSEEQWAFDILQAQLQDFKPDVWFCHSWIAPEQRLRLRAACPSIRFVVGYDGALNHDPDALAGCDAVLTCVRESADFYTRRGLKGYWLPWGFDPRVCERLHPSARPRGGVFCGSLGLLEKSHYGRVKLLDLLHAHPDFDVYIRGFNGRAVERQALSALRHGSWDRAWQILVHYQSLTRLRAGNRGTRYGLEMFKVLADAKVVLNMHGDAVTTAANIRLFEATGVGSCLLTDWKDDLRETFDPDSEVVTYRSDEECVEKLDYLLAHDRERQLIAEAGQRRCHRDHRIGDRIVAFADETLAHI